MSDQLTAQTQSRASRIDALEAKSRDLGEVKYGPALKAIERATARIEEIVKIVEKRDAELGDVRKREEAEEERVGRCDSEIEGLQKEIGEVEKEVLAKSSEVENSRKALDVVVSSWGDLNSEHEDVNRQLEEQGRECDDVTREIAETKVQKQSAKKEKSLAKKELQELEKQEKKLTKELEQTKETEQSVRQKSNELDQKKGSVLSSLDSLHSSANQFQTQNVTSSIDKLKLDIKTLIECNSEKAAQIQKQNIAKNTLLSQNSTLVSQQSELSADSSKLQTEHQLLSTKKSEIDRCFNDEKLAYIACMDEWGKEKSRSHDTKSALTAASSDHHQQNHALDEQIKAISAEISQLNLNIDLAKKRLAADKQLQKRIKKREAEIDSQIQAEKRQVIYTKVTKPTILPNARPNRSRTLQLD